MILFVIGGIALAVLVVAAGESQARELRQAGREEQLELLRRERGGSTISATGVSGAFGRIWGKPVRGGVMSVYFHLPDGREATESTRFTFRTFSGKTLPRFEVYSTGLAANIAKAFGMQDIEVGDRELDDAFILKAPSDSWMRAFMTWDVRSALKRLARRYTDHLSVSAYGDTLELRVERWLDGSELTGLYTVGELLAHELLPDVLAGTEPQVIPAPEPVRLSYLPSTAHCLVCGDALSARPVVCCRSCDTPHHSECWHYNGRCAVYGCSETRGRLEVN